MILPVRFKVEDLNFGELIKFFGCMSMQARRALVHNNSMYIDLTFTDDLVDDTAIENLLVWFQACDWMQQLVQSNRFNGVRIPWTYRAFGTSNVGYCGTILTICRGRHVRAPRGRE